MANPYSSPAESGNKVNYPAREPHTYIEALHRPLPKHHPQRVQEVRKYLDRKDHGKVNIQNLFKDEKINLDVHRSTDMEKGEKGKHELGKNLMWTQGEVTDLQEMIIELKGIWSRKSERTYMMYFDTINTMCILIFLKTFHIFQNMCFCSIFLC